MPRRPQCLFPLLFCSLLAACTSLSEEEQQVLRLNETFHQGLEAYERGHTSEALAFWQEMAEANPSDARARVGMAMVYADQGKWDSAMACIEQAMTLDPKNPLIPFASGNLNYRRGHLDSAIESWQQSLRLDRDYAPTLHNVAMAYHDRGHYREAVGYLDRYLRIEPSDLTARYYRALALLSLGRTPEEGEARQRGRKEMVDYLKRAGDHPAALLALAVSYAHSEEHALAESYFLQLVAAGGADAVVWYRLGGLAEAQGYRGRAVEYYRKALESDPAMSEARDRLDALIQAQRGETPHTVESGFGSY